MENQVILPLVVIEELDGLKKADGEKGINARDVIRSLENLRLKGDLLKGVELEGGGSLRIEPNCSNVSLPEDLPDHKPDNRILQVCLGIKYDVKDDDNIVDVVLVTKDLLLRMKAGILGITSEDYLNQQVQNPHDLYKGRQCCYANEDLFSDFNSGGIDVKELYKVDDNGNKISLDMTENEFVIIYADRSLKKTLLGKVKGNKVIPLKYGRHEPYGVKPRNAGQYFMQEALMLSSEEAPLVIIKGMAGTAKTFYSLAVGLDKVWNANTREYRRILVSRPNAQFDDGIGFLPGSEQEKISPLMRPIYDNLEQLVDSNDDLRYSNEMELQGKVEEIFSRGIVQAEAMNFIRGRSFMKTYLIIDEAQNLTPNQVKGIITRAGKGTKIILLGDPNQIDIPFLDERTNGLSYASERMKGSKMCYQVTLNVDECERSELAFEAINIL
jgi:PhoH-like ATPase